MNMATSVLSWLRITKCLEVGDLMKMAICDRNDIDGETDQKKDSKLDVLHTS